MTRKALGLIRQGFTSLRSRGVVPTVFLSFYRTMQRLVPFLWLQVLVVTPEEISEGARRQKGEQSDGWGFLGPDELARFARTDASLGLDPDFLADALSRGDRCYGCVTGARLVTYAWFSKRPVPLNTDLFPGLVSRVGPDGLYYYKAYTAPDFRGQKLQGRGVALALEHLVEGDYPKFLVSLVEVSNTSATRSSLRTGYRRVGTILVANLSGRNVRYVTSGCQRFGIAVE